jgi:hypothetical protein
MTFEPGNYYVTRGGKKAYVDARRGENPLLTEQFAWPLLGVVKGRGVRSWMEDGRAREDDEGPDDLVGPWVEPVSITLEVVLLQYSTTSPVTFGCGDPGRTYASPPLARKIITLTEGDFE